MLANNEMSKFIQEDILRILKWFDQICKNYNLKYYLAGGTLLGAIRHHGFIPRDDDIDLFMDRTDYEKLIKLNLKDARYKIFSLVNDSDYYYPYIKIIDTQVSIHQNDLKQINGYGLWIDIFPLDNGRLNLIDRLKLEINKAKLTGSIYTKFVPSINGSKLKNKMKKMLFYLYHKTNPQKYAIKIDKIANKSNKYKSDTKRLWCLHTGNKDCYESKRFSEKVDILFEDAYLPCPAFYHEILTRRYGDYMTLPPECERISYHDFTFLSIPNISND